MVHIDFFTVLISAVIYMIISSVWYSKYLFGKVWMRLKNIEKKDIRNKIFAYISNFAVAIVLSYFLSLIEIYLGATSFLDGIVAGAVVYIGFVFPTQIVSAIWVKNSFKVFLIDNGCFLLSLMIMGGVLVG